MCVCARDRTRGLTFDFLPASFLIPASYFVLQASDADDSRQLRQVGEPRGLQRYGGTQETGRLGGFGETGRGQTGAWPVVHLEEEDGAAGRGKKEHHSCYFFFSMCLMGMHVVFYIPLPIKFYIPLPVKLSTLTYSQILYLSSCTQIKQHCINNFPRNWPVLHQ